MKNAADQTQQFALCLDNEGYPASLELGKLYRVVPDEEAVAHGYIRIIDERGEDYAFTANRFHMAHCSQCPQVPLKPLGNRDWDH